MVQYQELTQEEWRVLLRDSNRFWLGVVILMGLLSALAGLLIGLHFG